MAFFDARAWDNADADGTAERASLKTELDVARAVSAETAVRHAVERLMAARRAGDRSSLLGTVTEFDDHCIDAVGFDPELAHLNDSRLRGPWAELRDELKANRIYLIIRHSVRGQSCRSAHWAFDIIAQW